MKTRENIINSLKQFWVKQLEEYISIDKIVSIFQGDCTGEKFFRFDLGLYLLKLEQVNEFCYLLLYQDKVIETLSEYKNFQRTSDFLIEIFKEHNLAFDETALLYENFKALESWAERFLMEYSNYDNQAIQQEIINTIKIYSKKELKEILIRDGAKIFSEEQIDKLKEISVTENVNGDKLAQLINLAIALRLSKSLNMKDIPYQAFSKIIDREYQVTSYDELKNFELYKIYI